MINIVLNAVFRRFLNKGKIIEKLERLSIVKEEKCKIAILKPHITLG